MTATVAASDHLWSQEFGPGEFEVEAWLRKPDLVRGTWQRGACSLFPTDLRSDREILGLDPDAPTPGPCTGIIDSNSNTKLGYALPELGVWGSKPLSQGTIEDFSSTANANISAERLAHGLRRR